MKLDAIKFQLKGQYKVSIVDSYTNKVIWEQKTLQDNLILNDGLDSIGTRYVANCWTYGIIGTGTRQNTFYSSGSSANLQGNLLNLTASGVITDFTAAQPGYNNLVQPGDVFLFDTGSIQATVVSVNSSSCLVTPSGSFATGSFSIWKTSQRSLQTEQKRSNTYISGLCGSTFSNDGKVTAWRTYDFTTETASVSYNEVGTSWTSTTGTGSTFSRVLLPTTVIINSGQKLRLYYQILSTYNPITPVSISANISGWPVSPSTNTSGSQQLTSYSSSIDLGVVYWYSSVSSNGSTVAGLLEPVQTSALGTSVALFVSNDSQSIAPYPSLQDRSSGLTLAVYTVQTYVTGTYEIYKYGTFSELLFSSLNIRCCGIHATGYFGTTGIGQAGFILLFDQNQSKNNQQTLTLYFRWAWGRTLQ